MNEALKPGVVERAAPAPGSIPEPAAAPPPPARKKRGFVGWIVFLVVLGAGAAVVWHRIEQPTAETSQQAMGRPGAPQTVRVATIDTGDMPIALNELGTVTPFETVTIKTQISGKLESVGFAEGQMVKQGDFIAQIDPKPYEAALAQAKGQLAKDQALLAQAESNLERYETLSRQDSISKQQVTDQQALVAQDQAAIQTDQAQIQTAQINLDYTHIVSPITGRTGLRQVDPGNYLQPTDASGIVVITELDPISVVFSVPEDSLPQIAARLKSGADLGVTAYDRANVTKLAEGRLTTYDSQVDTTTGTIKMRATFANPDGALFPNQFVNVRLLVDTLKGAVLAPNAAVQIGPSGDFVYVLNADGTVAKRDVAVGPADGRVTTITSGLSAGDKVVIDGVDRLRDGAKVTVVADGAGGGATAHQPGAHHRREQGEPAGVGGSGAKDAPAGGSQGASAP